MKNKIIKILDKYINEYPDTPLKERNGKKLMRYCVKLERRLN